MPIASIYVFLDDGRCVFSHSLIPNPPPYLLVTGLLAALQDFVQEVSNTNVNSFSAGEYTFLCETRGNVQVVLAISASTVDSSMNNFNLLQIALRFINRYGEILEDWDGNTVVFDDFIEDLEEMLGSDALVPRDIVPTDLLTPFTLMKLNKRLQVTAQTILQLNKGSAQEISELSGRTVYQTQIDLEELVELGHIGRYTSEGNWIYFIQ